jgi:hypothetical protein
MSFAAVMLFTGVVACSASTDEEMVDSSSSAVTVVPAPVGPVVVIFRAYNGGIGDHLLSQEIGEGAPFWGPEGPAFKLFPTPTADAAPLFRCSWIGGSHHFTSNDPNCEGYTNEGLLGWVTQTPKPGLLPLVRCFNGAADHVTTLDPGECVRAGFGIEGPQGFASP